MKQKIKLLGMDVDGTLTDGKIHVSPNGEIMKSFDVKDGYGIKNILPTVEIIPVIISARSSEIVRARAKELNVTDVYLGVSNKIEAMNKILAKYGFEYDNIAYIGDDLNDLPLIEKVGLSFAPSDSVEEVRDKVDVVLKNRGGSGAVRECISYLTSTIQESD